MIFRTQLFDSDSIQSCCNIDKRGSYDELHPETTQFSKTTDYSILESGRKEGGDGCNLK